MKSKFEGLASTLSYFGTGSSLMHNRFEHSTKLRYLTSALILTAIFHIEDSGFSAATEAKQRNMVYCLPSPDLNINPFRIFDDPTRLFYLVMLTKPYLSESSKPSILARWQFSPDGLKLSAETAPDAKWKDGRAITSREAAVSLAKGLLSRPIGKQIKPKNPESFETDNWGEANHPSIRLIDDKRFEIEFVSVVQNSSGVLREALSDTSTGNRIWPVRFGTQNGKTHVLENDLVSKFEIQSFESNKITIAASNHNVDLIPKPCSQGDFFGYGVPSGNYHDFSSVSLPGQQDLLGIFNPRSPGFNTSEKRKKAYAWLSNAFSEKLDDGFIASDRHFVAGEVGYQPGLKFASTAEPPPVKSIRIQLGTQWPEYAPVRMRFQRTADQAGITLSWQDWNEDLVADYDMRIAGSKIRNGRHLWTQEILDHKFFANLIEFFPVTLRVLKEARRRSSSTIPVDKETLLSLEKATVKEYSVLPLGRYSFRLFSAKDKPIFLDFDNEGVDTFSMRR